MVKITDAIMVTVTVGVRAVMAMAKAGEEVIKVAMEVAKEAKVTRICGITMAIMGIAMVNGGAVGVTIMAIMGGTAVHHRMVGIVRAAVLGVTLRIRGIITTVTTAITTMVNGGTKKRFHFFFFWI